MIWVLFYQCPADMSTYKLFMFFPQCAFVWRRLLHSGLRFNDVAQVGVDLRRPGKRSAFLLLCCAVLYCISIIAADNGCLLHDGSLGAIKLTILSHKLSLFGSCCDLLLHICGASQYVLFNGESVCPLWSSHSVGLPCSNLENYDYIKKGLCLFMLCFSSCVSVCVLSTWACSLCGNTV